MDYLVSETFPQRDLSDKKWRTNFIDFVDDWILQNTELSVVHYRKEEIKHLNTSIYLAGRSVCVVHGKEQVHEVFVSC